MVLPSTIIMAIGGIMMRCGGRGHVAERSAKPSAKRPTGQVLGCFGGGAVEQEERIAIDLTSMMWGLIHTSKIRKAIMCSVPNI